MIQAYAERSFCALSILGTLLRIIVYTLQNFIFCEALIPGGEGCFWDGGAAG